MINNILSQNVEYKNGNRISTQTVEIVTTLSDDMATLANYHGTLAALQSQVEQMQSSIIIESQKPIFDGEIARIKSEMETVRKAVEIQNGYIKGFEQNAL